MVDMVMDLSKDKYIAAWLYGFDVNSETLQPAHRHWLDTVLVKRATSSVYGRPYKGPGSSLTWHIWLTGAASRTGSRLYNLELSKRRTGAVIGYIDWKLLAGAVRYTFKRKEVGENFWALLGRPDQVESKFQRGVLVVARDDSPVEPEVKVPAPQKTYIPVLVRFCFAAEKRNFLNIDRWSGRLFAFVRTKEDPTRRPSAFWWEMRGTGVSVGAGDVPIIRKGPDDYRGVSGIFSDDVIFGGYDVRTFNSVYDLDYLGQNFVSVRIVHYDMRFEIKEGLPTSKDIALKFKVNAGWELSQTAPFGAAIGKMRALSASRRKTQFPNGLPRWSEAENQWTFGSSSSPPPTSGGWPKLA